MKLFLITIFSVCIISCNGSQDCSHEKCIDEYRVAVYQLEGAKRTFDRLVRQGDLPKDVMIFPNVELPESWEFLINHYEQNKHGLYKGTKFRKLLKDSRKIAKK